MLLLITSRTTSFEKSCVCAYLPIYFLPTCMKLKWQRLDLQSWWWWPTILQILLHVMFYRLPEYIPCWTVVLSWNSFSICRHMSCHLVMKVHVLEVIVCICVVHVCMCVCACVCVCIVLKQVGGEPSNNTSNTTPTVRSHVTHTRMCQVQWENLARTHS